MKTTLKLIALFSFAGVIAAVASPEAASAFNAEAGISLFVTAFVLLMFASDYTRRPAGLTVRRGTFMLPATPAFSRRHPGRPARTFVTRRPAVASV